MIKFELMGTDSIITWTEGGVEMTTQSDVASDRRVVQVLDGRVLLSCCVCPPRPPSFGLVPASGWRRVRILLAHRAD